MEAILKIIIEPSSEFLAALWSISAAMLGQKPAGASGIEAPTVQAVAAPTVAPPSILPTPAITTPVPAAPVLQQAVPFVQTMPVPVAATVPAAVPVPMPVPAAVPVATAPGYTLEQLGRAGAALVDAGKRDQLIALLNNRGVQALNQLDPAQYGVFATELRGLGAQI